MKRAMATKLWNKLVRQVTWKKASSQSLHSILWGRDSVPPKISPLEENPVLILPLHHHLHYPHQHPLTFTLSILCFKRNKNIKFNFSNFKYNICIKDFGCFLKAYTGEQYIRRLNSPVSQLPAPWEYFKTKRTVTNNLMIKISIQMVKS